MTLKRTFTTFIFLVLSITMMAVPARRGMYTFTQPDGTQFQAYLSGDEYSKSLRTIDGCAVTYGRGGYYCYASLDAAGRIRSSEVKVCAANSASSAAVVSRSVSAEAFGRHARITRNAAQKQRSAAATAMTKASSRQKKNIIILAEFPDKRFKYSRTNFMNMLTTPGYSNYGATGSALDYFNDQFDGKVDFEFIVSPIVMMSKGYAYYGANNENGEDEHAVDLVVEACRLAAAQGISFAQGDGDNDGEVDNVFIFTAGQNEAEGAGEEYIWPHQWYLREAGVSLTLDGKRINAYATSSEITHDEYTWDPIFTTIGTFCHEYSHTLGLKDHYDTDYEESGGTSDGVWGTTDLMDYGNYNNNGNTPPNFNAPELETFGLGTQLALETGSYTLSPIGDSKRYIKALTDKDGEYFLFECRTPSGWDKYIGGTGMLIYHVDKSGNDAGYSDYYRENLTAGERWQLNEINCRPDHQCLDIIEAVPIAKDVSQVFWPNGSHTSFAPNTTPAFKFWSGGTPSVSLMNIAKSSEGVTFTAAGPLSLEKIEEFQDAAIVLWTSTVTSGESTIAITGPSGRTQRYNVQPYATGSYSYTFEGLEPKTAYTIKISAGAQEISASFVTKSFYSDGYPFIYLNSAERGSDGTFVKGTTMPLRVFNAKNAADVVWQYSPSSLTTDGSGYYKVIGSGTIKAIVYYEDGGKEIISKTITVK
ncbi:MAG: M6 family metalloprotease domain-containing protein [Bacteroidia bacterium]|nr:M6 family metalloprotease domain-containing protein [Bacteroidia bacterium]